MTNAATLQKLATNPEEVSVWSVRPFQPSQWRYDRTAPPLVSLIEMLEHNANMFYWATYHMYQLRGLVRTGIEKRGATALPNEAETRLTQRVLKRIRNYADPVAFERVLTRISVGFNLDETLLQPLIAVGDPFTLSTLAFQLEELTREIAEALGENKFIMIPSAEAALYDNYLLFGFEVAKKFPEANKEIIAAGTCYTVGCYSACVFHLMRAVELAARIMVNKLKVQKHLVHRNGKPIPIELCDWGTLIAALEKGVAGLSQGVATSKQKKETFEFYNHALGSFRNFKDAWRNNVSHMRTTYQPGQAKDILDNTRQFMQHLAVRLKE